MRLELIAKMLQEAGMGSPGRDIFVAAMPADIRLGILLRNPLTGTDYNHYIPGYFNSKLQAIVRAPDYATGDEVARRLVKVMTVYNKEFVDPNSGALLMKLNHLLPEQQPIVYPHTPSGTIEWSLNFMVNYIQMG